MYRRILQLPEITSKKSAFLIGPRQTGKSTLIKEQLPGVPTYNLLDAGIYRRLSSDPTALRREILAISPQPKLVVIDEIQLLPNLLNETHLMIENERIRFLLTGSSARALKRRGVNLLGGRARMHHLHPLVSAELEGNFDLMKAIHRGLLPSIYESDEAANDLEDYVGLYLKEEIAAEGLSRSIPSFSRFLEVAALANGTIINATKIASDAEVKRTTVNDWFQILKDTLIGYDLPAWTKSKTRKAISSSKFYFFDVGVARCLTGQKNIERTNPWFGVALESILFHELRAAVDYGLAESLHFWRSTTGFEVDFLLDENIAIEVKASARINKDDVKGLLAMKEEKKSATLLLVYLGEKRQKLDDVLALPLMEFLLMLWARKFENFR